MKQLLKLEFPENINCLTDEYFGEELKHIPLVVKKLIAWRQYQNCRKTDISVFINNPAVGNNTCGIVWSKTPEYKMNNEFWSNLLYGVFNGIEGNQDKLIPKEYIYSYTLSLLGIL